MIDNMPLWAFLDELFENDVPNVPEGDDPRSWCAREVDEIIAEEEADDLDFPQPF